MRGTSVSGRPRRVAVVAVLALVGAFVGQLPATLSMPASAATAPVGNGFTVTPADLNFIVDDQDDWTCFTHRFHFPSR